jgi:hypothetical protein
LSELPDGGAACGEGRAYVHSDMPVERLIRYIGDVYARDLITGIVDLAVDKDHSITGTLASYSLARFRFRGRGSLLGLYLGSRMLSGIALIVPLRPWSLQ